MILSDRDIIKALKSGNLIIDPEPKEEQIVSTTIDLRLGEPILRWNTQLISQKGLKININPDDFNFIEFSKAYTENVNKNGDKYIIEPNYLYLAPTYEKIRLPKKSKLAARVEGKSSLARLGLVVHFTAPTIHCGFGPGIITLEMYNYGPFYIEFTPGKSAICQLIIERVTTEPEKGYRGQFKKQITPKGN